MNNNHCTMQKTAIRVCWCTACQAWPSFGCEWEQFLVVSSCLQATANLKQSALAYQPPIMQPVHNFRICQLQMILNCAPIFYRGARGRGVRCMGSTKCMKFGRLLSLPVAKNLPLTFLAKHFGRSFAQIRCSGSLTADKSFVSLMPVHHKGKLLLEIIIQFHGEIFFDAIYASVS